MRGAPVLARSNIDIERHVKRNTRLGRRCHHLPDDLRGLSPFLRQSDARDHHEHQQEEVEAGHARGKVVVRVGA